MANIQFSIGPTVVLGPPLIAFGLVLATRAARKHPGWHGKAALTRLATALYAAAVLSVTLLPLTVTYGEYANQTPWYEMLNPIPLLNADLTFLPNVVMFLPLGMLLPLVAKQEMSAGKVAARSLFASLAIEVTQILQYVLFNNGRSVDINDVIANTLGGLLGYLVIRQAIRLSAPSGAVSGFALPRAALAVAVHGGTASTAVGERV